jgi:hypothetical protein
VPLDAALPGRIPSPPATLAEVLLDAAMLTMRMQHTRVIGPEDHRHDPLRASVTSDHGPRVR